MAVNLSLGVQCAARVVPVHRNFVTIKPKPSTAVAYATNNQNPALKYKVGALVPRTSTTRRNLVTRRCNKIVAMAESNFNYVTKCIFKNSSGDSLNLDSTHPKNFWAGKGDVPANIQNGNTQPFDQGGTEGSVGGVMYDIGEKADLKWVVAWSNKEGQENKVYSEFVDKGSFATFDWNVVKTSLDNSSSDPGPITYGPYKSTVKIERKTNVPDMNAILSTT